MVAYQALQDFIPLYPLYQLLFTDHGLSTSQISTLFVIWCAAGFVVEVPSGAWADSYSRRKLLVLGALIGAAGYAAWIVLPTYAGFALGFVLWGISSALISGTYEAFVYDELAARALTPRYATLLGRARSASFILNLAATALASPLFALGGYALAAAVSIASHLAQAVVAYTLPEAPRATVESEDATSRGAFVDYLAMLRSGLTEVLTTQTVRRAVVLAALVAGFLSFDEYFPLLAREIGTPTPIVPLLIAGTVAAQAIGGALAGPAYKLPAATFAGALGITAVLIATGALSRDAWGFLPIALGYGVMQLVIVVADARLQDAITGPARATVTSVAGLFSGIFAIAVYAGFALGSFWFTMSTLVAALTIPVLLTAFVVPAAMPAVKIDNADSNPLSKS
ncbi:MFS transporter [Kribbella albertanoniae]|uniref:MFS transporter n=1 Tax=Kribbella albertanoniae TaxID=1266829 RepID=A0A4V2XML2_9ACTN|nr:MFS transporter [Kribbella albertanoniae]